jgi:hypothetical protein
MACGREISRESGGRGREEDPEVVIEFEGSLSESGVNSGGSERGGADFVCDDILKRGGEADPEDVHQSPGREEDRVGGRGLDREEDVQESVEERESRAGEKSRREGDRLLVRGGVFFVSDHSVKGVRGG